MCGRRDQQGRAVLGLITFLGFKEKLTLFLAVGFMESFPQEHRAVLTGTGVKQEGWKAGGQILLSCSQQNTAHSSESGSI